MPDQVTSDEIINQLLVDTFNTILKVEQESLRQYEDSGDLTVTEVHTLVAVGDEEGGRSMSDIASRLAVTVATVTVAINRLSAKGFVTRQVSSDDRRVVLVTLTESGLAVLKTHDEYHERMVAAATVGLSGDELDILISALSKVKEYFSRPGVADELIGD